MDKITTAYITSSAFSGSTLLTFILNSHPKIGTISEYDVMTNIKANKDYQCSCGKPIRQCEFFVALKSDLNSQGLEFQLDDMNLMFNIFENERLNRYFTQKLPLLNSTLAESWREKILQLIPSYKHFMNDMHHRNTLFMRSVLSIQQADVFVDANKNPYRIARLAQKHDVIPVYLFKNGIGGAYSFYTKAKFIRQKRSFKQACENWFVEQVTINRVIKSVNPDKMINLSYSEMCRDTQGSADKIFSICGLDNYDISDFSQAEHHIVGNAMRVSNADKIKEKTDWKDNLSSRDIDTYKRVYDRYMPALLSYNSEIENDIWYG